MLAKPFFIVLLALTPVLGVTTSFINSLFMGFSVFLVLLISSLIIHIFAKDLSENIRLFVFIIVIATSVTIVEMLIRAFAFDIANELGIFIPLLITSMFIFTSAEKSSESLSIKETLDNGIAFIIGISTIGLFREFFASGYLIGQLIFQSELGFLTQPFGAFISVAVVISIAQAFRKEVK